MPSIFDYILGRNPVSPQQVAMPGQPPPMIPGAAQTPSMTSMLDDTPSARDTLMGLSQGLISAGAPSPYPTDFGQVFGKAIGGATSAAEGAQDKRLKRALVGAQVAKANADIANDKAWQDMFKTPAAGVASPAVAGAPAAAAPAGVPGTLPATWDPHYQKASIDTGLSIDLLKAKDYAESGGNANAVSPAGAAGPAQLMPGTASDLGVTDPKDPAQAIPAGARYLAQQYAKYKDVDKALAAYNWGPANVDKWIAAGADPARLPAETQQYIAKIKAQLPTQATHGSATGSATATPVQLAQGNGAAPPESGFHPEYLPGRPNAAAGPTGAPAPIAPPVAGVGPAPAAAPAKTLPQVIESLPPAVRQMMGAMPRKDALPLLMKYADPDTHVAIDTTTGAVVFAPKNDNSGRYQPVDAMKLDIERQNAESQRKQAAAREESNRIRSANEPLQPPATPGGVPTPTPGYVEQKGAVTGAEAAAKVAPALIQHQGELVIKDHQLAQTGAEHARVGIANLNRLGTLLDQVNTNKFQGTVQDLKASAKAAGIDLDAMGVGDNVGTAQAAKALSQQMALQLRDPSGGGGMPGSLSDADRQFLTTMVPAITNDPNANKLMIDWQKKVHQRTIEVGKIVNDYVRSPEFVKDPAGVYAKVREYADKNPLFDPAKDGPKATASTVRRFNPATGALE